MKHKSHKKFYSIEWWIVFFVAAVAFFGLVFSFAGSLEGSSRAGLAVQPSVLLQQAVPAFPDCIDTDAGNYPSQQGSTYNKYSSYEDTLTDYCKDAQTLVEYVCDKYGVNSLEVPCKNGCENGVCL